MCSRGGRFTKSHCDPTDGALGALVNGESTMSSTIRVEVDWRFREKVSRDQSGNVADQKARDVSRSIY